MYRQFASIFETFRITEKSAAVPEVAPVPVKEPDLKKVPKPVEDDDDDDLDDDEEVNTHCIFS